MFAARVVLSHFVFPPDANSSRLGPFRKYKQIHLMSCKRNFIFALANTEASALQNAKRVMGSVYKTLKVYQTLFLNSLTT